jgi:hypothetical protein
VSTIGGGSAELAWVVALVVIVAVGFLVGKRARP